jgi:hypothetical protein
MYSADIPSTNLIYTVLTSFYHSALPFYIAGVLSTAPFSIPSSIEHYTLQLKRHLCQQVELFLITLRLKLCHILCTVYYNNIYSIFAYVGNKILYLIISDTMLASSSMLHYTVLAYLLTFTQHGADKPSNILH